MGTLEGTKEGGPARGEVGESLVKGKKRAMKVLSSAGLSAARPPRFTPRIRPGHRLRRKTTRRVLCTISSDRVRLCSSCAMFELLGKAQCAMMPLLRWYDRRGAV